MSWEQPGYDVDFQFKCQPCMYTSHENCEEFFSNSKKIKKTKMKEETFVTWHLKCTMLSQTQVSPTKPAPFF